MVCQEVAMEGSNLAIQCLRGRGSFSHMVLVHSCTEWTGFQSSTGWGNSDWSTADMTSCCTDLLDLHVPALVGLSSGRGGPSWLGTCMGHAASGSVPVALLSSPRLASELQQCEPVVAWATSPTVTWSTSTTDCRVATPPDSMRCMLGGGGPTTGSATDAHAVASDVSLCMCVTFLSLACAQSDIGWAACCLLLLGLWAGASGS